MMHHKAFEESIRALHRTFEEAEHQLSRLGDRLQYLIGPDGTIEIVRRGKTGDALRPKIVVATLAGCDPMLWRPEHPRWLRSLDPGRDRPAASEAAPEVAESAADEDAARGGPAAAPEDT